MKRVVSYIVIVAVIASLILVGCAKSAPTPTPAPAPAPAPAPPPIKIGVLYPLTGPTAMVGEMFVAATKFGFEQVGYEVAGRKIEVIVEDSGGATDVAVDKARKLVEYDKVCMLIGPLRDGVKLAVAPYMAKMGVPQISSNAAQWKMTEYEWSFMPGGTTYQPSSAMAAYAYDKMGLRKVTVMIPDTAPGHEKVGAFMDTFKKKGGQVIQEQYTPFPCTDYAPYLTTLKDADAVVAWFEGADAIRFHSQYHEFGIRKRMPLIGAYHGGFIQPFLLNKLPPEVANAMIGEYCLTTWTPLIETDISKRFVEAWKKKYDYTPDDVHSVAYLGAEVALEVLKATGGDTTPEKLRQVLLALDFESIEGHIRIDPETRFAIRDVIIIRLDRIGAELVQVPVYTYKDVPLHGL